MKLWYKRGMMVLFVLFASHFLFLTPIQAQTRFGFLSYQETLQTMPEYGVAMEQLSKLRQQFSDEMKRAEEEFNKKYEEFLEGQQEFAVSIRNKRQSELEELMTKNMAFKQEAHRLLESAEAEAMRPLREKLAQLLNRIGSERGLAFILNTDNNALPYIDPSLGVDLNAIVKSELAK